MKDKLLQIINHYGLGKQLKYIHTEYFELDQAITEYEYELDGCNYSSITDMLFEHIEEEIADIMVMLKQFQYYYEIEDSKIEQIMAEKNR